MSTQSLSLDDTVRWSDTQLATEVEGDVVLMSIENGAYYGLDSIGSEVWREMAQPVPVSRLCETLSTRYSAEPSVIQRDVLALLDSMMEQGLIERA